MPSENSSVDNGAQQASQSAAPASGHPRRTLIRAALMAVPTVLTLNRNASAQEPPPAANSAYGTSRPH